MGIYEIKYKIVKVWAAARVIVKKYDHTKKFAKNIIALVIKQEKNLRDYQLAEFLGTDPIGKILGYKKKCISRLSLKSVKGQIQKSSRKSTT